MKEINLRKEKNAKKNGKKHFTERPGDWICYNCQNLKDVNFQSIIPPTVKDFSFMFDGCRKLKDLPDKLEAGTPNIEGVIGLGAAIDYLNELGIENINKYEHELRKYLIDKLKELGINPI